MITPFGRLEPVDSDKDGIYELQGEQRIAGAYNADGLATVKTVLSYRQGDWQARSVSISIPLNLSGRYLALAANQSFSEKNTERPDSTVRPLRAAYI